MHPSVSEMWQRYLVSIGESPETTAKILNHFIFGDNREDADYCADLTVRGIKQATSPSLWWFEHSGEAVPQKGDVNIVTDWKGRAQCVIETTSVEIVPYNQITEAYAAIEGEGDKSLAYWQKVHWPYYFRELKDTPYTPTEDMPIVCECFKVIFR